MTTRRTADELALRAILTSKTEAEKTARLAEIKRAVTAPEKCEECGSDDVCGDGDTYFGETFRCMSCGAEVRR